MEQEVVVLTTTDSMDAAAQLARQVVEARLAACVQVVPIQSVYRWQGEVQEDAEVLLVMKTRASLFEALEAFIKGRHTYQTPEIVGLPIIAGSAEYLGWIAAETT